MRSYSSVSPYVSAVPKCLGVRRTLCTYLQILEPLELTPEAGAMWTQLSDMALSHGDVMIAERCAAALGDVSRAAYLLEIHQQVQAIIEDPALGYTGGQAKDHWSVKYKLCLLQKDLQAAEEVLLSQGKVNEAIDMYDKVSTPHVYEVCPGTSIHSSSTGSTYITTWYVLYDTVIDSQALLGTENSVGGVAGM